MGNGEKGGVLWGLTKRIINSLSEIRHKLKFAQKHQTIFRLEVVKRRRGHSLLHGKLHAGANGFVKYRGNGMRVAGWEMCTCRAIKTNQCYNVLPKTQHFFSWS